MTPDPSNVEPGSRVEPVTESGGATGRCSGVLGSAVSVAHAMDYASRLERVADCFADRCIVALAAEVTRLRGASGALALAPGSATCCLCNWTNVNLLNLGEPGAPRWTCHGCCKRMLDALEKILRYPVHSEPVGGAMAMQDIAHEALSPNAEVSHRDRKRQPAADQPSNQP